MQILEKATKLLEVEKTPTSMCRIYLQRIDHIYFKFDTRVIQQRHVSLASINWCEIISEEAVLSSCSCVFTRFFPYILHE